MPDHLRHPDKYTCYVLDEPLVVGGGVGQLAGEQRNVRAEPQAPAGAEEQPEAERWEGPVGVAGAVQFQPRKRADKGSGAAAAGGAAARKPAVPQLQAAFDADEEAAVDEDAEMQEAAAAPRPAAARKHYRSRAGAADED